MDFFTILETFPVHCNYQHHLDDLCHNAADGSKYENSLFAQIRAAVINFLFLRNDMAQLEPRYRESNKVSNCEVQSQTYRL